MLVKTKNIELKKVLSDINSRGILTSEGKKRVMYFSSKNAGTGNMDAEYIKSQRYKNLKKNQKRRKLGN